MSEIHFVVEEAPEGGFIAKAINEDIDLTDHMNDAVKSLKIVIAADQSIHTGQVVALQ